MTKYVVSGYIGFDNFGDEAIAKVLTDKLKEEGAEKITLISSNPEKTAQIHNVNSCPMLKFIPALIESDTLISGGGSLLQDVTSFKSLIYYLGVIFIALILRKKVIIYAQGIGPIKSITGQILTKILLKKCSEISVRDEKSQQLLENWKIKSKLVNDPILDLQINKNSCTEEVGIQLRDFSTLTDNFLKELAKAVSQKFSNKKIKIISLQDSLDLKVCQNFQEILKDFGINDTQIFSALSVNQAFEVLSNLEYLIAMRFHANVVGIKSGTKTIAINYDPKVEKLARQYNLPTIELTYNMDEILHIFE